MVIKFGSALAFTAALFSATASQAAYAPYEPGSELYGPNDPTLQQTIRLDEGHGVLAREPVLDSLGLNDCYADAAASLLDAMRKSRGVFDPAHPVGPVWLAASTKDITWQSHENGVLLTWGISYEPKPDSARFPFLDYKLWLEFGSPISAFDALKRDHMHFDESAQHNYIEFCDDSMIGFEGKKDLVDYWLAHASETEKKVVLSNDANAIVPLGAKPLMAQLSEHITRGCYREFEKFRIPVSVGEKFGMIEINNSYDGATKKHLFKTLNSYLDLSRMPVMFMICDKHLIDGNFEKFDANTDYASALRSTCTDQLHFLNVVGRRISPDTGSLEYLLRNSWGKDGCSAYALVLRPNCESDKGSIWIDAYQLMSITVSWIIVRDMCTTSDGVQHMGYLRAGDPLPVPAACKPEVFPPGIK